MKITDFLEDLDEEQTKPLVIANDIDANKDVIALWILRTQIHLTGLRDFIPLRC